MRFKKGMVIGLVIIVIGLPIAISSAFLLAYRNKVYPKTWVADIEVSGLPQNQVEDVLKKGVEDKESLRLDLVYEDQSWQLDLEEINLAIDYQKTSQQAFNSSRETPIKQWFEPKHIGLEFSLNENLLAEKLATISSQIYQPTIPTQILFDKETKEININEGKLGQEIDLEKTKEIILGKIAFLNLDEPVNLIIKTNNGLPSEKEIESARQRVGKLINKSITLTSEEQNFIIEEEQLINFVGFISWWDEEKITEYSDILCQSIDQPAQDALFKFESGKVTVFQPNKLGFKLDQEKTKKLIIQGLNEIVSSNDNSIKELPLEKIEPEIKTSDTNRLGITELIGEGKSSFRHSITSRIHNINIASGRLHGTLIDPGETFSLNQALGEISKATGYQSAYIIKDGRTVLGDGGGVCQVSTTMFRAALDTGLPIIERRAHAYRVSYYEQDSKPGLDATVFSPSPDLKFKNDTNRHILIQTVFNPKTHYLAFQFYGTSDNRESVISNIRLWDVTPPPDDQYIDDPTLPIGTVKQIDWKSWGAKAAFDWKVTRDGETICEQTFYSAYRPWQAIFLKGTKPD